MTDWRAVVDDDFAVPADAAIADLVAELSTDLTSPDPVRRDEHAYSILATWIDRGVLDEPMLRAVGDEQAARFTDDRIQARTFAPLILAAIVGRGVVDTGWRESFIAWYPTETDLRGHDPELGWLHAVAHGADLLGALGDRPDDDPASLLDAAARRLVAPTPHVWRDQEDDRLAFAIGRVLASSCADEETAVGWLDVVDEAFASGGPGPVPPFVGNTTATLRALYVVATRGVRPRWNGGDPVRPAHSEALADRIVAVLSTPAPYTG